MKGKKAQAGIEISLSELIQIVLVVIVVMGLLYFAADQYFGLAFEKNKKAALDKFKVLTETIDSVKIPYTGKVVQLSFENHMVVGFSKGTGPALDACPPKEKLPKPDLCGNNACLCLYEGGDEDVTDNTLMSCKSFKDVDEIFTINYFEKVSDDIYKNVLGQNYVRTGSNELYPGQYSHLFIYGSCDGWWNDESLSIQSFYVEKLASTDKVRVLVAINNEAMMTRKTQLTNKFGAPTS